MSAIRLDSKATVLGLVLTLVLSAAAQAQQSGGQWRLSPEPNRSRRGVEVKPQALAPTNPMQLPAQPVAFNLVPAVLMSDGTVWANFGFGFEPVVRSCTGATVVVGQPGVIAGNGALIVQPSPPTYTQPVPVQKTASQQMIAGTPARSGATMPMSNAAQLSCFGRDAAGRVFVIR